jgi:acyl transferase domain-containing protein
MTFFSTDGDTIRAVIRGTGLNQDGKTPGITMTSPDTQADLIRTTYVAAGLSLRRLPISKPMVSFTRGEC